ncbi:single-stranded DNA-binding protein [Clostridium baratii]|uniref:single-stranded DNA-binding protein n=1 Tax=Clostridium baratii TaxID=1561 RepID=UPI0005F2F164|nr:single-stranded DNA-binding protein [Clostridium baratii]AQM58604.1 hypothetical protein NPD11_3056 [Clostridium baratii]KJU70923.1 hypothetical protein UC77_12185 [Clostridium baratii]
MNNICLSGNLVNEGELKKLNKSETIVYNNTLAVKDYDGKEITTYFFKIRAFGKLAEHISRTSTKGTNIGITGKLVEKKFTKDGQSIKYNYIEIKSYESHKFPDNYNKSDSDSKDYSDYDEDDMTPVQNTDFDDWNEDSTSEEKEDDPFYGM